MARKLNATPDPVHLPHLRRTVQLGKLERKADRRNLKFARYVKKEVAERPPPRRRRTEQVAAGFGMYGNDALPDCTIAAMGNMERLWSAVVGSPELPTDESVLEAFDATGPRSEGRYELDVLNYWRNVGFGPDREKILAFVQLDPKNDLHLRLAIELFGGVYVGLALPISAQRQKVWQATRGADAAPGSWGGHAVPIVNYDWPRKRLDCVTWATVQPMTLGFWHRYGDECYAIISPDWLDSVGRSPKGFDLARLEHDLAALG